MTTQITVKAEVKKPVTQVWNLWTQPEHIIQWNNASPDWHSPKAENDLKTGGKFNIRMEAKDGSMGFDFAGVYDKVVVHKSIEYTIGDGRKVQINFSETEGKTLITETFEAEQENSIEMQRSGWQSIMDNFKRYSENQH